MNSCPSHITKTIERLITEGNFKRVAVLIRGYSEELKLPYYKRRRDPNDFAAAADLAVSVLFNAHLCTATNRAVAKTLIQLAEVSPDVAKYAARSSAWPSLPGRGGRGGSGST